MEFKVCELNHFEEDILNTFIYCTQNDICSVGIIASNEIVSYVVDALIPFNCFSFNTKNDFHFENDNYLLYVDELKDILIESVTDENYIDLINQYNNSIFFVESSVPECIKCKLNSNNLKVFSFDSIDSNFATIDEFTIDTKYNEQSVMQERQI